MTKVFQGAGRLLNHSTLFAVKMESIAHSDVAAHREGSSRDIQSLYFDGSTTTILGLSKASSTEGRNKGYRRCGTLALICLHVYLIVEMSPETRVLKPCLQCSTVQTRGFGEMIESCKLLPHRCINPLMGGLGGLLGDEENFEGRTQLKEQITKDVPWGAIPEPLSSLTAFSSLP